jgi:DNA-binding MarR family transcriptional regulator
LTAKQLNNIDLTVTCDPPLTDPRWGPAHVPSDPIAQRLKAIAMLNREIGKKIGEALGVNVTDMAALEHLVKDGPLTPSQLAGCLKVSTAAATQIVDRLERAGHVSRRRMDDDRRKIFVVPTEASIERAFEQFAPVINAMDQTLARMTQTERQVVETFLDQVIAVYRNAATPPPASSENP